MKRTMIILTLLLGCSVRAFSRTEPGFPTDSLLVVFWNVENFFDYR